MSSTAPVASRSRAQSTLLERSPAAMANPHDPDRLLLFDDPIHDDVPRSTKHDHAHLSVRLELHTPADLGMDLEKVQNGIELAIE